MIKLMLGMFIGILLVLIVIIILLKYTVKITFGTINYNTTNPEKDIVTLDIGNINLLDTKKYVLMKINKF